MKIIYAILATILGISAFRQFGFEHLRFRHVGLGLLYLLAFAFCVGALVRGTKSANKADE